MAPIIKQKITQKQISFWKLLILIGGAILVINMAITIFSRINPIAGTIGGLVAFAGAIAECFLIIYKSLAYYNYRLIDDDFVMERVFGRANHLFLSLKLSELELFLPYEDFVKTKNTTPVKLYKFVLGKNMKCWYVGEFTRSGDRYRFIIEPNEEIIKAITSYNAE